MEQDTELENAKQIMRGVGEGEDISPFEISDAFVFLEKKKIKASLTHSFWILILGVDLV